MVDDSSKKRKKRKHKKNKISATPASNTSTTANSALEPLENIPEGQQNVHAVAVTQPLQESPISVTIPQNPTKPFRNVNRGRGRGRNFGKGIGRRDGRGFRRDNADNTGENDAYCMEVAPLNIFENQVVPMGLHNFQKYLDLISLLQESFL